jgi:hypothetical protein
MPRVLSAKGKRKRKGRPPKAKHVPLSAIDFGDASDDEGEIVQRVPWKTPVAKALEALDTIDRHIVLQEVVREIARGSSLAQRALLAQRVVELGAFILRDARL